MTLFVVGGSNSVFRDGWACKIGDARNLSVGATTTLCGIYRCLQPDGPKAGDTIIWEYGVNEIVHSRKLYGTEVILRNLEHFLRLANQRNWKVVPLMLVPQLEEREGMPAYYQLALDLFRHYGLSVVDVSAAFRRSFGKVPCDYYTDPVHYRRDDDVAGQIGRMVQEALRFAARPSDAMPLRARGELGQIEFKEASRFTNSIMSVPLTSLPATFNMDSQGIIRALVVLCRPGITAGIRMRLTRQGEALADARISTTCKSEKTLLKALNTDNLGDWSFKTGDRLALRYIEKGGFLYAEQGLQRRVQAVSVPNVDTLAGILVERPDS